MTDEQIQRIALKVQQRLKDNNFEQELVLDYTEEMGYKILSYCHRDDIPIRLEPVWVRMVVELLMSTGLQYLGKDVVVSVKEGDTEVKYGNQKTSNNSILNTVTLNYTIELNNFRQLRGMR